MRACLAPFRLLWRYRAILSQTTRNDMRARYAGSVFGMAWMVLYPLLFLGGYAAIYLTVFKVRFELFDQNEYVVLIFCGLIPFLGFAEAIGLGVVSVTGNANLVKNTLFPIELIPVKSALVAQCTQGVGLLLLMAAVGLVGKLSWWALMLPVVWGLQVVFTLGVVWVLGALNVVMRDLQNVISVLVLLLFMVSPIAYTVDMVPESMRGVLWFNPLFYIITCYQDILVGGKGGAGFPRHDAFWVLAGMSMVMFLAGYWFFTRMKKVFADHV